MIYIRLVGPQQNTFLWRPTYFLIGNYLTQEKKLFGQLEGTNTNFKHQLIYGIFIPTPHITMVEF